MLESKTGLACREVLASRTLKGKLDTAYVVKYESARRACAGAGDIDKLLAVKAQYYNWMLVLVGRAHSSALITCKDHESKEGGGSYGRPSVHLPTSDLHIFYRSKLMQIEVFRTEGFVMDRFLRYKEDQVSKGVTFHHVKDDQARAKLMAYSKQVTRVRMPSLPSDTRRGARAVQAATDVMDEQEAGLTVAQKMRRLKAQILGHEKAAAHESSEVIRKGKEYEALAKAEAQSKSAAKRKRT